MKTRKPKNIAEARFITNDQLVSRTQLCLSTAKRLSREFGAYIPIGTNHCRHDWVKFCEGMENLAKNN